MNIPPKLAIKFSPPPRREVSIEEADVRERLADQATVSSESGGIGKVLIAAGLLAATLTSQAATASEEFLEVDSDAEFLKQAESPKAPRTADWDASPASATLKRMDAKVETLKKLDNTPQDWDSTVGIVQQSRQGEKSRTDLYLSYDPATGAMNHFREVGVAERANGGFTHVTTDYKTSAPLRYHSIIETENNGVEQFRVEVQIDEVEPGSFRHQRTTTDNRGPN